MILEKDWLFVRDDCICDVRTVGVLVREGKLLVQRDRDGTEYALPGGHIKIGETLEAGLVREWQEEMGASIRVGRMLWSEECFWQWHGKQAHNIAFYFLVEECSGLGLLPEGEFRSHKDNCSVVLGWMALEKLKDVTIYPQFLKEEIGSLEGPVKHFVSR